MLNATQLQKAETATVAAGIADKVSTGAASIARLILLSQIGRLHKHVSDYNTKRAEGTAKMAIGDIIGPLENRAGVKTGTFARLASVSRALFDKYTAFAPMDAADLADADKLKAARKGKFASCLKDFEEFDGASNARKFAQDLKGVKVDKTDREREQDAKADTIRTEVEAKAPGSTEAAKASLSDDPATASLEWLALGKKAAKDCGVEWSKWLATSGLHEFKKVTA